MKISWLFYLWNLTILNSYVFSFFFSFKIANADYTNFVKFFILVFLIILFQLPFYRILHKSVVQCIEGLNVKKAYFMLAGEKRWERLHIALPKEKPCNSKNSFYVLFQLSIVCLWWVLRQEKGYEANKLCCLPLYHHKKEWTKLLADNGFFNVTEKTEDRTNWTEPSNFLSSL